MSGISGIFTYQDLNSNRWGSIIEDQPILAEKYVNYIGEPIVIIAGISPEIIDKAKKLIQIKLNLRSVRSVRGIGQHNDLIRQRDRPFRAHLLAEPTIDTVLGTHNDRPTGGVYLPLAAHLDGTSRTSIDAQTTSRTRAYVYLR